MGMSMATKPGRAVAVGGRGRLAGRLQEGIWPPLIFGILLMGLWEYVAQKADPLLFAPPSRILAAIPSVLTNPRFLPALGTTIGTMLLGFLIAVVLGVALGVVWGRSELAARFIGPLVNILYPLPRAALVPVVVIWFGIDLAGRVFVVVFGTLFDVMVNTYQGVRFTDKTLLDVGRSFGASNRDMLKHIIFPYALPYVMAGLRLGIGRSLIGVVVAELFLSATGLGELILRYGTFFQIPQMLVTVFILSVLGMVLTDLLRRLEMRVAPWKASRN